MRIGRNLGRSGKVLDFDIGDCADIHTTISVAKLAIADMIPVTIPQANFEPCEVLLW